MMIGQKHILELIDAMQFQLPHFIILVGPKGSGKTCLTKYIADRLEAVYSVTDIKVDAIREVIDTAYKIRDRVVYHIKDADTMRAEAKNAMLKITEESPKEAYFVITVQNDASLLDTIKSRALVLYMEPYSRDDLKTYFWQNYNEGGAEVNMITDIAETPYQVDLLVKYGLAFIDYVNLVLDNISLVEPANAFKSGSKLSLKEDDSKYDILIFLKTFLVLCEKKITEQGQYENKWADAIIVTNKYIDKLGKLGVSKVQMYDNWVFEIREVLYDNN